MGSTDVIHGLTLPDKRRIEGINVGKLLFRQVETRSGFNKRSAICLVRRISTISLFMKNTFCIERAAVADKRGRKKPGTEFFNKIRAMQITKVTSGTLMPAPGFVFAQTGYSTR